MHHARRGTAAAGLLILLTFATRARAQDNYEIQVYGSETVTPGQTMIELHSNYTVSGARDAVDGVLPTQGA